MTQKWLVLNRQGYPVPLRLLPPRPDDAKVTEDGDPYTPWEESEAHLHLENGQISGIHTQATLLRARRQLTHCLEHEALLLEHFGTSDQNVDLFEALSLINKWKSMTPRT